MQIPQNIIDLINSKFPEHKFSRNNVELYLEARHNFATELGLFRIAIAILSITLSLFFYEPAISEVLVIPLLFFLLVLLLGIYSIYIVVVSIFQKPKYIITDKYLYIVIGKKVDAYLLSHIINDITILSSSIRLKLGREYRKEDDEFQIVMKKEGHKAYSGDLYICGIKNLEEIALSIWQKLIHLDEPKERFKNLNEYLLSKPEMFRINTLRRFPTNNYIFIFFIGLAWVLGSFLFIFAGLNVLIENWENYNPMISLIVVMGLILLIGV